MLPLDFDPGSVVLEPLLMVCTLLPGRGFGDLFIKIVGVGMNPGKIQHIFTVN